MTPPRLFPPLWFLLFALLALALERSLNVSIELGMPGRVVAWVLGGTGVLLALWARWMFLRARTTAHPFQDASRLLTHGAYRISRNPMYLGMLLMLIGLVLWLQNLSGLILPPLFAWPWAVPDWTPQEPRAQFGEEDRDADAYGHGDEHGDQG